MARTVPLAAHTSTYFDLIGNGKRFQVPPYQRDYSWEEEQWEDLWNDIVELRTSPDDRHYMGALVLQGLSDREFSIIDGQQRLVTLSNLALTIIKKLRALADAGLETEANRERAEGLRARFIGEKDPASLVETSKLYLSDGDNAFYQDYLVQLRDPLNPPGLPKSNRLLWDCFKWFFSRLDETQEISGDGRSLASLLSETIVRQLLFIQINVDDELNAYTVFETLNARGLELSATDLLKNYLFSRVRVQADWDVLQRRWKALIATVRQERFPEFLRYHLLCEYSRIRSQRLFKIIRDRVKTPQEVFSLVEALENRSELYNALGDPNHEYWIEYPDCRPAVRELAIFKVRQMTPLLFAAWERLTKDDLRRVLRDPDTDSGTIEHILPERPGEAWESGFPADDWGRYVYRLGNLTLQEPGDNRAIGNSSFRVKAEMYGRSSYRLTQDIAASHADEWTPERLKACQRKLAERAAHIWRADFA